MPKELQEPKTMWRFKLRIWHLFVVIALAAYYAPKIGIFGNYQAVLEVEDLQINLDEQWGKRWATFDCTFERPQHRKGERLHCFIEVDDKFDFGHHKIGDQLIFRYQEKEFWNFEQQDPRQLVLKKFFGLEVLPSKYEDGLYIRVGIENAKGESSDEE